MMLPTVPQAEIDLARQRLMLRSAMRERRRQTPIEWYQPSHPGLVLPDGRVIKNGNTLGFHQARHPIRVYAAGNGSGKTTAMGAEVYWQFTHTHPYLPTPKHPMLGLWFVRLSDTFELTREQLVQQAFGTVPTWKASDSTFVWPDGGRLVVAPADNEHVWRRWQGIPVDLVAFDEWPPYSLLVEMLYRRRGDRQTKFLIGATNTDEGDLWPREEFYEPWLKHHVDAGLSVSEDHEDEALARQLHPRIWLWMRGGIQDNPGSKPDDRAWYESLPATSSEQKKVRLDGGFMKGGTRCIFDAAGMEFIRKQMETFVQAKTGSLVVV